MAEKGLKDLYLDELRDIYNAENQLVKALPKMAKASTYPKLKAGFEEHLQQTQGHVQRLEQIFSSLGEDPKGKTCKGMKGLVEEGEEVIGEKFEENAKDSGIIGAAQRVEHYEIAAYGTARELAKILGRTEDASLLEQTLEEEKETDKKLTTLAMDLNRQASAADNQKTRAANA
jgi:ferritin-like metal-binding protein YciE